MPEAAAQFVGNSIEELLVSLADGVREAQSALNNGPLIDAAGRPMVQYQLPYLDFTVQVDMQTVSDSGGRPVALMFMRRGLTTGSSSSTQNVTSTISGRLVATPPGDGLPVPRIGLSIGDTTVAADGGGTIPLTLAVTNNAGETLANQRVELNIDDDASRALSAARGLAEFARSPATRLLDAVVTTDAVGTATARLAVGAGDLGGKGVIAVVASIGPFSARAIAPLASSQS